MLQIKPGVRILGLRPELSVGLQIVYSLYPQAWWPLVITSCTEGTHSPASLHYSGSALDFRRHSSTIPDEIARTSFLLPAQTALGQDFDFLLEATHYHLEYQPKAPY